jgi:hypothetical protein
MPLVCSTTKDGDIAKAGGKQLGCCHGRPAIGFTNHHNRLSPGGKFSGAAWQIGERHVDRTRQMARARSEFLGLTHIDQEQGVAGRQPALQFSDLDRRWHIDAWPPE